MQNLKKQLPEKTMLKKNLPPNPIIRQPAGSSPPNRLYLDAPKTKDLPQKVEQPTSVSWSPQPFRMANNSTMDGTQRETFIVANKEVFNVFFLLLF